MTILCYPNCTTCKKAQAFLQERKMNVSVRNIKEQNPTYEELKEWQKKSNLPWKRFFNTSGGAYRALGLKDRLPKMSEEEQAELLASDGMLVKRPILLLEDAVLVGFRPAEWEQALK
ncbi:MAG: arsenate reductase family protein [Oscillospiraceae bacterium]|nr:arsenate reductase family protein [Oscillospiraceae bacterium]